MRIAIATRPPVLAGCALLALTLLGPPQPRAIATPPVTVAIEAPPFAVIEAEVIRPPAMDPAIVIVGPAIHDAIDLAAVTMLDRLDSMLSAMFRAVLAPIA